MVIFMVQKHHKQRGIATLELLIAFALAIFFITGATLVSFGGQSSSLDSNLTNHGMYRIESDLGSSTVATAVLWNQAGTVQATTSDIYSMNTTIGDVSPCMKLVGDNSNWTSEKNRAQYFNFSTLVANIAVAKAMGGGCNPFPPTPGNDWHDPELLTQVSRSHLGNVDTNDFDLQNSILYIASGGNAVGKPDIIAEDGRNLPSYPPITPANDIVDGDRENEGEMQYSAIEVARNAASGITYAYNYVGNDAASNQLQIIDMTNAMTVIPHPSPTVISFPPSTPGNGGGTLYFYNGRLYVGIGYNVSNPELLVYDVHNASGSGSPLGPTLLGTYDINHNIYKIVVREQIVPGLGTRTLAYLAISSSSGSPEVEIIDVTSPAVVAAPVPTVGTFNPAGNQYGLALSVLGNYAYVGLGSGASPNFYVVDISDPRSPTVCGTCHANSTIVPYNEDINDVAVAGGFAFLATSNALRVLNVSDPSSIVRPSTAPYGVYTEPFTTVGIDSSKDLVYATHANQGNVAFYVLYSAGFGYTLSNGGNIAVTQGSSGSNTITRTLTFGAPSDVVLNASGLPAGASATFTNNPCTPTCSSQLTIATTYPTTPVGNYTITVSGGAQTTQFNLVVNPAPFDYSLNSPAPSSGTVYRGVGSFTNIVTVTQTAALGSPQLVTLTPSNLAPGVAFTSVPASESCTPTTVAPYTCTVTFTYTASAGATLGTRTITVNGASPAKTTTFSMTVADPVPFSYTLPNNLPDVAISNGGAPFDLSVTVTMAAGASPQPVTLMPTPNPSPSTISVTAIPVSSSCTPNAVAPYACVVIFRYTTTRVGHKSWNSNTISGTTVPVPPPSNIFKIIEN